MYLILDASFLSPCCCLVVILNLLDQSLFIYGSSFVPISWTMQCLYDPMIFFIELFIQMLMVPSVAAPKKLFLKRKQTCWGPFFSAVLERVAWIFPLHQGQKRTVSKYRPFYVHPRRTPNYHLIMTTSQSEDSKCNCSHFWNLPEIVNLVYSM